MSKSGEAWVVEFRSTNSHGDGRWYFSSAHDIREMARAECSDCNDGSKYFKDGLRYRVRKYIREEK